MAKISIDINGDTLLQVNSLKSLVRAIFPDIVMKKHDHIQATVFGQNYAYVTTETVTEDDEDEDD